MLSRIRKATYGNQAHPGGAQGDAEATHRLVEGEGKMSAADKLQEFVKMLGATSRPRPQAASIVAGPSQTNLVATENTTVDSASVKVEATPAPDAERENGGTTANQALVPLTGLDLDTAIRLRWTLRDIKAKRTKITSVSPTDLKTLIEMGLVEMRDEAPMLTNEGHRTLDQ